jgi:GTP cyclohydrolase I
MMLTPRLADVQNQTDDRGISIDRVGVTELHYPITLPQKAGTQQRVTARVSLFVGLHERQRGAHLSSLVDVLDSYHQRVLDAAGLVDLARAVRSEQDARGIPAELAEARIRFKFFVDKTAPVSRARALMAYDCGLDVVVGPDASRSMLVEVPVSTVCPCSLEISDVGAHNQRARITLRLSQDLEDPRSIWFEDLIACVEGSASAEAFSVLKRSDEKLITERMFSTPRFVEDVLREAVMVVRERFRDLGFTVRCESLESIHAHNACAEVAVPPQRPLGKPGGGYERDDGERGCIG